MFSPVEAKNKPYFSSISYVISISKFTCHIMMLTPTLHSNRFTLREHREEDLLFLFQGLSDLRVTRYYDVSYTTLEETKSQLKWVKSLEEKESGCMWVITDKNTGQQLGVAGIYDFDKVNKKAEIGYWVLPEFWGQGITKEALELIHEYAFNMLEFNRLEAYVIPENENSKSFLKKVNYTHEGLLRDYEYKDGTFVSYELYTLLKTD